jgi:hypothetical protein
MLLAVTRSTHLQSSVSSMAISTDATCAASSLASTAGFVSLVGSAMIGWCYECVNVPKPKFGDLLHATLAQIVIHAEQLLVGQHFQIIHHLSSRLEIAAKWFFNRHT